MSSGHCPVDIDMPGLTVLSVFPMHSVDFEEIRYEMVCVFKELTIFFKKQHIYMNSK